MSLLQRCALSALALSVNSRRSHLSRRTSDHPENGGFVKAAFARKRVHKAVHHLRVDYKFVVQSINKQHGCSLLEEERE